jgi:PAS domain S-box-containing protein
VLQAVPEGIALTDHEGRVLMANHALAALIGADEATLQGSVLAYLVPWHGDSDGATKRSPFEETSRPASIELKRGLTSAEGILRISRSQLPADDGRATSHVWLIRDVTQQKLAEEAREQFVDHATHELRTPLANIKAYAETLSLHDFDDAEQRRNFLNTINTEASRLARFVDDLLNISRMEAGSLTLHLQKTDVLRLLTEVVEKVRPQIEQKELTFGVTLPTKLPELTLDKENLIAALVNVLGNAAKYTPTGGKVTLRVEHDGALQIHVEDTGFGIAKEEIPKLCSKFFRSSDPRVQEAAGTGLGLAFTNEIVRLHGGRMQIHSELDKGSRFTITLPA